MILQLLRLWQRGQKLQFSQWRALGLLMLGALIMGVACVCLDVGAITLFLQNHGLSTLGFDFLWAALGLSIVGRCTVKLDRRKGYGAAPWMAVLTLLLVGLLWSVIFYEKVGIHLLLIYRYTAPVLMIMAFWSVAHRFIILRFNSYKFIAVFMAQLVGMLWAGLSLYQTESNAFSILSWAVVWMGCLFVVVKCLVWLLPVPSETFVKKTGGVQDPADAKMLHGLLVMGFLYMVCMILGDSLFYHTLMGFDRPIHVLARLWMWRGLWGLIGLMLLYRIRFVSALVFSLYLMCLSGMGIGVAFYMHYSEFLFGGMVAFFVCSHLYWAPFLSMVPRVLALGHGPRLRWRRQVVAEPVGVVLAGALLINFGMSQIALFMMLFSVVLMATIYLELSWYSRLLLRMCQTLRWCGGPLILFSRRVIQYVKNGVKRDCPDESIYFLRIMQAAQFADYPKQLLEALHHPDSSVRLFALEQLDINGWVFSCIKTLNHLFQKDPDIMVRSRVLAILIRIQSDYSKSSVFHKYGDYLDNPKLKSGAILGFLQSGAECALLAMDGLQKLAQSSHIEDNLLALEIMDRVPQTGLVRLVGPLLKKSDPRVIRHALLTAGRIGHTQTLSAVLSALDDPNLQEAALRSLNMYGKTAFPPIEKMLSNIHVPMERRRKLVLFLGAIPSGEGKQILLRNLDLPDENLRRDILQAVLDSQIVWVSRQKKKILYQSIQNDMQRWRWFIRNRNVCAQSPTPELAESFAFLMRSFTQSIEQTRQAILKQLLLLYPDELAQKCIKILLQGSSPRYLSAVSLLQDLISHHLYQIILPMLNASTNGQLVIHEQNLSESEAKSFLQELFLTPEFSVDRWVQACALNGLKYLDKVALEGLMSMAMQSPYPVVWEALLNALKRWVPDDHFRQKMLQQMCTQQVHLAFMSYLKSERVLK